MVLQYIRILTAITDGGVVVVGQETILLSILRAIIACMYLEISDCMCKFHTSRSLAAGCFSGACYRRRGESLLRCCPGTTAAALEEFAGRG